MAADLKQLVDTAHRQASGSVVTPIAQPRGEVGDLVVASFPDARLRDLVVPEDLRARLQQVIAEQRQRHALIEQGFHPAHRLLLEGPAGTGKTLTAAVLAHELDLPLLTIRLDSVVSKYLGETGSKLRVLFDAVATQRAVYLFDEFDALGGDRAGNDVGKARRAGFFNLLAAELAFYVGCLNLIDRLSSATTCFPAVSTLGPARLGAVDVRDVALVLTIDGPVVGNDIAAGGKNLVVITGANQGGKSSFLRALGQAQLMAQAGMFVLASEFNIDARRVVLTHYKREEDPSMTQGKFAEELARMSVIVDRLQPGGLVLLNESFAATNEQEGSLIAHGVVTVLLEDGVKVVLVTHLYPLADALQREFRGSACFMRAERLSDGTRTFKLREELPLPTSCGPDTYRKVFEAGVTP